MAQVCGTPVVTRNIHEGVLYLHLRLLSSAGSEQDTRDGLKLDHGPFYDPFRQSLVSMSRREMSKFLQYT
jgi:hypothetical protein